MRQSKLRYFGPTIALALLCGAIQPTLACPIFSLNAGSNTWDTGAGGVVVSRADGEIPTPAMWACANNDPTCDSRPSTGPTRATLSTTFFLSPGANVAGAFDILADDLLIVNINQEFRFAAALDQNPDPLRFRFDGLDLELVSGDTISQGVFEDTLRDGQNFIQIRAFDGHFDATKPSGTTCTTTFAIPGTTELWCETSRVNRYVYLEGFVGQVPEPGTSAMVLVGFAGISLLARRFRTNR